MYTQVTQKSFLVLFMYLILALHAQGQELFREMSLYYAVDEYRMTSEQEERLKGLVSLPGEPSRYGITVEGHTDATGDSLYNQRLSKRRVKEVGQVFEETGISRDSVRLSWFGENRPVATNSTSRGRQANRRVEIRVFQSEQPAPKATGSIHDLYTGLRQPWQLFYIRPDSDTILVGQQETLLGIRKHSFDVPDSLKGLPICIRLREVYDKPDMILHNLQTLSGERLLETGGMIQLEAGVKGQPVSLLPEKSVEVFMPAPDADEEMELFAGVHDSLGHMDWERTGDELRLTDNSLFLGCDVVVAPPIHSCPFFFCKIRRFFMSARKKSERREQRQASLDRARRARDRCKAQKEAYERYVRRYGPLDGRKLRRIMNRKRNMKSYLVETNRLGWLNLDKFSDYPDAALTTLSIDIEPDIATDVHVVFRSRNSLISGVPGEKAYHIDRIPQNVDVLVVAIRHIPGRKPLLGIKNVKTGRQDTIGLNLEETTEEEMKEALEF